MGLNATPETIAQLQNDFNTWTSTNLAGREDWNYIADPYAMIKLKAKATAIAKGSKSGFAKGTTGIPSGMQQHSTTSDGKSLTGANNMIELNQKAQTDPYSRAVKDKIYESLPENLKTILNSAPQITESDSLVKSIPNFNKLSSDKKQSFIKDLNLLVSNYADRSWLGEKMISRENLLGDLLKQYNLAYDATTNDFEMFPGLGSSLNNTIFGNRNFRIGTNVTTAGHSKVENEIVSSFKDHLNKFDKWYDGSYANAESEINKYLTDKNTISFLTNQITANPDHTNDLNATVYNMIKVAGTDELTVKNLDGKDSNRALKNALEAGGKVDFVSIDLGSEYSDNNFKISITKPGSKGKTTQEFIINPNISNLKEFSYNLATASDSFAPIDAVYSKLLFDKTFATGKDSINILDVRNAGVYDQPFNIDNTMPLTALITKEKDGSFVLSDSNYENPQTGEIYKENFVTLAQASDALLQHYEMFPDYKYRYIQQKINELSTPKEKKEFLEAQLDVNNITLNEIDQLGFSELISEDNVE